MIGVLAGLIAAIHGRDAQAARQNRISDANRTFEYVSSKVTKNADARETGTTACYCTSSTLKECPNNVFPYDQERIDGPRFFHRGKDFFDDDLCCKMAEDSWFGITAGMSFKKQETDELCKSEVRPVPPTSCCFLHSPDEGFAVKGEIGVRVSQVTARMILHENGEFKTSLKTGPIVHLSDIIGSTDWNGYPVSADDARLFATTNIRQGWTAQEAEIQCENSMDDLVQPQRPKVCFLRTQEPSECCCPEEGLSEVSRCLPAEGAPTEAVAGTKTFKAEVIEEVVDGLQHTKVQWGKNSMEPLEPWLPGGLHMVDPVVKAGLDWRKVDWQLRGSQWTGTCSKNKSFPVIEVHQVCPPASYTRTPPCYIKECWINTRKQTKCHFDYMSAQTVHTQGSQEFCIEELWERNCPAGTAAYSKMIPEGQCMTLDAGLVEQERFVHSCPAGYKSGDPGRSAQGTFDNRCHCNTCAAEASCKCKARPEQ